MTKDAPMVEEITDFEVLEVALRELYREGAVHRRRPPAVHRVRRRDGASTRIALSRQGLDRFSFQEASARGPDRRQPRGGNQLAQPDRLRDAERLHGVAHSRGHPYTASRSDLHSVLLLPTSDPRELPRVVPDAELPASYRSHAPAGACGVRSLPHPRD